MYLVVLLLFFLTEINVYSYVDMSTGFSWCPEQNGFVLNNMNMATIVTVHHFICSRRVLDLVRVYSTNRSGIVIYFVNIDYGICTLHTS